MDITHNSENTVPIINKNLLNKGEYNEYDYYRICRRNRPEFKSTG